MCDFIPFAHKYPTSLSLCKVKKMECYVTLLDLEHKSSEELCELLENVKTSSADVETKTANILNIEKKLGLNVDTRAIYEDIKKGMADMDGLDA